MRTEENADGYYLTVTLDAFDSGNFKDVAKVIVQSSLKEAGIKVDLNMMEYAAWTDQVKEGRNFNMTMLAGYQGPDISESICVLALTDPITSQGMPVKRWKRH